MLACCNYTEPLSSVFHCRLLLLSCLLLTVRDGVFVQGRGGRGVVPAAAGPVRGMDGVHVRPCEDFIIVVQCVVPTCPPSLPPSHPRSPTLSIATAPKLNSPVSCLLGSDSCTTHPGMRVSMYLVPGLKDISLPLKIWSHTIKPSLPVKSIRFLQRCHSATSFIHLSTQARPFLPFTISLLHGTLLYHCQSTASLFLVSHITCSPNSMCKEWENVSKEMGLQLNVSFPVITRILHTLYVPRFSSFIFPRTWCKSAGLLDNF